jgi:hypothetical protein
MDRGDVATAVRHGARWRSDVTAMGLDVERALDRAGNVTKSWPTHALFSEYP